MTGQRHGTRRSRESSLCRPALDIATSTSTWCADRKCVVAHLALIPAAAAYVVIVHVLGDLSGGTVPAGGSSREPADKRCSLCRVPF